MPVFPAFFISINYYTFAQSMGCQKLQAEIIPFEPGTGNAV